LKRSLYKLLPSLERVEKLLSGQIYCETLNYFQALEAHQDQGDPKEGVSVFRPSDGLVINKVETGEQFILDGHSFESAANTGQIFVFCTSLSLNYKLAQTFNSFACVEILDVAKFCSLVTHNLRSEFVLPPVDNRSRIGHKVKYYDDAEPPGTRWALPELIAISKRKHFSYQDEFRLIFGRQPVFNFENTKMEVKFGESKTPDLASVESAAVIQIGNISSFCKVHKFL
jgi:hypothetical protein